MDDMPIGFEVESFVARFPEFDDAERYPLVKLQNYGYRATMHITPDALGMPLVGKYRQYALFLMAAHLIALDALDDGSGDGTSLAGTPFKATVGSIAIEATKPNSFQSDDWSYWLNQTKYGRELLAYLDPQANPGIYLNTPCDTVRDLP